MAVQAAFEDVGDQHGVVDGRDVDAVASQHRDVVLGVLADLQHGRRVQQRLQPRQRLGHRDLHNRLPTHEVEAVLGPVTQRDIGRFPRRDGEADPDKAGLGGGQAIRLGVEGDDARLEPLRDPRIEGRKVLDADIGAGVDGGGVRGRRRLQAWRVGRAHHRRGRGGLVRRPRGAHDRRPARSCGDAGGQGAKLHRLEEGDQHVGIRRSDGETVQRLGHGRVLLEADKLPRHPHLIGEGHQGFAALGLFDLARPGQKGVEVAELGQQLSGGLHANPRGARHIVHAVPCERLDLDHPLGAEAELLDHLLAADAGLLDRVHHADAVVDQLHQVLVGRDDHHLVPAIRRRAGIGGDEVVSLVTRQVDGGHAEGSCRLAHQGELRNEVRRRRGAVGLVLVVDVGAERRPGGVEDHREVGGRIIGVRGLKLTDQAPHHVAEAGDRADGQAV